MPGMTYYPHVTVMSMSGCLTMHPETRTQAQAQDKEIYMQPYKQLNNLPFVHVCFSVYI